MNITPSERQLDALTELINIGVGRGASVLNTMLESHIVLQVPFLRVISYNDLKDEITRHGGEWLATVEMSFRGNFTGSSQLIFSTESASKLVAAMVGEEPINMDMDEIRGGTLCEVGNIVLNGVMGSISNMLKFDFSYSVPNFLEENADNLFAPDQKKTEMSILLARTSFQIERLNIDGDVILFFEVASLKILLDSIDTLL